MNAGGVAVIAADRPAATGLLERLDHQLNAAPLFLSIEQPDLLPAPAMTAGLVARAADPFAYGRVLLDCNGSRVEGDLDAVLVEQPEDAPDAGPAAVLVHRLSGQIAESLGQQVGDLGHPFLPLVPKLLRVFGSFFVIDDDAQSQRGVIRPADPR